MKTTLLTIIAALFVASAVNAASPLEVAYQAAMAKKTEQTQQADANKGTYVSKPWLTYKVDRTTLLEQSMTVTNRTPVELQRTVGDRREWTDTTVTSRVTTVVAVTESTDRPVWVRGWFHRTCLALGASR